jgi:hypothetical protein
MRDGAARPLDFVSADPAISEAVRRYNDLFERARAQAEIARERQEALAAAQREHAARRSATLVAGGDDVGRFDPTALERDAAEAIELAEALVDAATIAREQALTLAVEREREWVAVADKRLDAARRELSGLLDRVAKAQAKFEAAWVERVVASNAALRERANARAKVRRPELPNLDAWRAVVASSPFEPTPETLDVEREAVEA